MRDGSSDPSQLQDWADLHSARELSQNIYMMGGGHAKTRIVEYWPGRSLDPVILQNNDRNILFYDSSIVPIDDVLQTALSYGLLIEHVSTELEPYHYTAEQEGHVHQYQIKITQHGADTQLLDHFLDQLQSQAQSLKLASLSAYSRSHAYACVTMNVGTGEVLTLHQIIQHLLAEANGQLHATINVSKKAQHQYRPVAFPAHGQVCMLDGEMLQLDASGPS